MQNLNQTVSKPDFMTCISDQGRAISALVCKNGFLQGLTAVNMIENERKVSAVGLETETQLKTVIVSKIAIPILEIYLAEWLVLIV